jgi:hypothetical protein
VVIVVCMTSPFAGCPNVDPASTSAQFVFPGGADLPYMQVGVVGYLCVRSHFTFFASIV